MASTYRSLQVVVALAVFAAGTFTAEAGRMLTRPADAPKHAASPREPAGALSGQHFNPLRPRVAVQAWIKRLRIARARRAGTLFELKNILTGRLGRGRGLITRTLLPLQVTDEVRDFNHQVFYDLVDTLGMHYGNWFPVAPLVDIGTREIEGFVPAHFTINQEGANVTTFRIRHADGSYSMITRTVALSGDSRFDFTISNGLGRSPTIQTR